MLLTALVLLFAASPRFDDGAIEGVGGTVELISGSHPSIRMESEVVHIDRLPYGRVKARFVFKNYGKSTWVKIGFPGSASGGPTNQNDALLGDFISKVDGKRAKISVLPSGEINEKEWKVWYVKRVHFSAGQTRVIEDSYVGGGYGDTSGFCSFTYILETGASWHGSIGDAVISVDTSGLYPFAPIFSSPSGYKKQGRILTWHYKDFKPAREQGIDISWYPAFRNVYLNGKPVALAIAYPDEDTTTEEDLFRTIGLASRAELDACVRVGDAIQVPIQIVAKWLGASLDSLGHDRYRFERKGRWAIVTTGSRIIHGSRKRNAVASFPAFRKKVTLFDGRKPALHLVDLSAVVRALGGTATLDNSDDRLDLKFEP